MVIKLIIIFFINKLIQFWKLYSISQCSKKKIRVHMNETQEIMNYEQWHN